MPDRADIGVCDMSRLKAIYDKLFSHYGELDWWPAKTPYEVMTGAVLTQNTAWSNVEKAISNFGGRLSPEFIENISSEELIEIIRPSGFYNQKAVYLKALTKWYKTYGYSVENVRQYPLNEVREELLAVRGLGFETADSILLYAFSFPTFVVDAYTKRLLERLGIDVNSDYSSIKFYFESRLKGDAPLYNNYHALIVINAKEHCKKKPLCAGCPLLDECKKPEVPKVF